MKEKDNRELLIFIITLFIDKIRECILKSAENYILNLKLIRAIGKKIEFEEK